MLFYALLHATLSIENNISNAYRDKQKERGAKKKLTIIYIYILKGKDFCQDAKLHIYIYIYAYILRVAVSIL